MASAVESCARELLETVPLVMRFIRAQVRRRRTADLTLPQFRALTFISRVRSTSLSAAAEHLGLSLPAMSRLIHGLVTGGLVGRRTVSTNRRQVALTLTARGRATLETVRDEIRRQLAGALGTLRVADQKSVQRAMQTLRDVFGREAANERQNRASET